MSQVRRRRALRCSVLAASLAVLASLVVAPPASAEDVPDSTTAAPTPSAAPVDEPSTPGTPAPGETVVGELQQAWPDPTAEEHEHEHDGADDHAAEQPLSWIDTGDGAAVRVPTDALPDVAVGSTIAVTVGDPIVDEASAEQGFAPAVDVQAATVLDTSPPDPTTASAGSAPTNTVTAVLVLPAGASADGMTVGTVVNTLNGDVAPFWDEQSNGSVRISAVQGAPGWVSSAQTCSSPFALWSDVARQINWTEGPGKHLMLYVPGSAAGCAYGLGTVGSSIGTGGYSYVRAAKLSVMGHELGHNFGLGHSSELQCNSTVESGTCRTRDYYDFYDIMGISWDQVGTLNVAQAARLGLLPASEQVALTTSSVPTTVTLSPVSAASGTRTAKLTGPNGTVYYLEYRQAGGRDAWLGDSRNAYGLTSGVVLRRASTGANTSLLLDGTPSASSGWDRDLQQALPSGTTVPVADGAYTVTVLGLSATSASVRIRPVNAASRATLDVGETLRAGQRIVSANGLYTAQVQQDGNLVVYGPGARSPWASQVYSPGAVLSMQVDGNVVQYAADGRALWSSGTWNNPGATLSVGDDGALVLTSTSSTVLWSSPPMAADALSAGQSLFAGQSLVSSSGGFTATMQADGNLVVYGPSGRVVWSSGSYGPGAYLKAQDDGNAVVYGPSGRVLWTSGTWGRPGARLALGTDGALAVRPTSGPAAWSSTPFSAGALDAGQLLFAGQSLVSSSGGFTAAMQADGNLVVYGPSGRVVWSSGSYGPGAYLKAQDDGNAVVYGPSGRVLWTSDTWGRPGARLALGTDGALAVLTGSGTVLWGSPAGDPATLLPGQFLAAGQSLVSDNGGYRLSMQSDGNLVAYTSGGAVRWASGVYAPGAFLVMQKDGNLVTYDSSGRPVWSTGTWGRPDLLVELGDDGTTQVRAPDGTVAWSR